jgi:hypothetical protein
LPGLHKKVCDWLRLNLITNPEAYYIDPASQAAQQAAQAKAQGAQQQAQQQAQMIMDIEQLKAEVEKYKVDNKTSFDYFDTVMDAQVKMSQAEEQGAVDVIRARADAEIARHSNAARAQGFRGNASNGSTQRSGGKAKGGGRNGGSGGTAQGD